MLMIVILFVVALLMEASGSYISILGLSSLFGTDYVILFIACILDIAKISSVSFLYQYWDEIKLTMKSYLTAAVVVLMIITSAGAFGYLSGAFQKAIQPNYEVALRVESYKKEQEQLLVEKQQLIGEQSKFNQQLAQLPPEMVTGRQRLIKSFKPEQDRIRNRLDLVTKRTDELRSLVLKTQSENIDKDVHAGPITYVSKAFNVSMEDASKWIILTIIVVFDPLAIMLVLAGNFLIKRRKDEKSKDALLADLEYFQKTKTTPFIPKPNDMSEAGIEKLKQVSEKSIPDVPEIYEEPKIEPEQKNTEEIIPVAAIKKMKKIKKDPKKSLDFLINAGIVNEKKELLPVSPKPSKVVEVETETIQLEKDAHFIEAPESSLANLKINYPQALFRPNKTPSSKRSLYEGL